MEEYEPAHPLVRHDDAPRVPWTARLEVFEQDFDTAMAIWSVEDAVVGRLCADEQPVTRRRRNMSSSQVEFSQLSDFSQLESSQRTSRSKKRRRKLPEQDGDHDRETPLPPLSYATSSAGATQDLYATQILGMEGQDRSQCISTQVVATQDVGDVRDTIIQETVAEEQEGSKMSTPSKYGDCGVFKTPTASRQMDGVNENSGNILSSFSQADVVRESPLESCVPSYPANLSRQGSEDKDARMCTGFSTGSGESVLVSRKRMRDVELSWSDADNFSKSHPSTHPGSAQGASIQEYKRLQSDSFCMPKGGAQDANSYPVIDPRRLSFSTTQDKDEAECGSSRNVGFQTGSGRSLQPSSESLRKYEALLFGDEVQQPNPNMKSTTRSRDEGHISEPDSFQRVTVSACLDKVKSDDTHTTFVGLSNDAPGDYAGSGKAVTGFQTGTGRQVAVSRDRLSQYSLALFDDSEEKKRSVEGQSVNRFDDTQMQVSPGSVLHPAVSSMSGFQTAAGRTVEISTERLKEMEDRLFREDRAITISESDEGAAYERGISPRVGADVASNQLRTRCTPSFGQPGRETGSPTIPSGFQTGSGSHIHISRERLRMYEQIVLSDGDDVTGIRDEADVESTSCKPTLARPDPSQDLAGGSCDQASLSKQRLDMYEEKPDYDQSDQKTASLALGAVPSPMHPADVSVGFATARGTPVVVSEEKLRLYAQKFVEEDATGISSMTKARHPAPIDSVSEDIGGFTTGSGRQVVISAEKLREYQEKLIDSEETPKQVEKDAALECTSRTSYDCGASRRTDASDITPMILSGFSTGSGNRVSISERALLEYKTKISEATGNDSAEFSTDGESKYARDDKAETNYSRDSAPQQTSARLHEGRPPRSRHSFGAPTSSKAAEPTIRRHSLPPRTPIEPAHDKGGVGVSSGVIQRMAIAHQRNAMPPVLEDVSNTLKSRSRVSGLSGGGKWKPPSQLQSTESGGYSTPAKNRIAAPQSLSGEKGFRPPVPLKTPPSKSLMMTITPPQKVPDRAVSDRALVIKMPYREAMRISYKLLSLEVEKDSRSFTSESRAVLLRDIDPERALAVVFSRIDGELLPPSGEGAGVSVCDLFEEMKERGHIGSETGVTLHWFQNQYRWVVWKLATLELLSPRFLFGRYATKSQVMFEICKRYQRDIVLAQRSILKKILNRDANAASCMVLRIAAVLPYPVGEEKDVDHILPPHWKLAVVLTDGWHGVYAVPDTTLAEAFWKHHRAGRLVGKKIVTWSATLQNTTDGIDPLECALMTEKQWQNPLWAGKDDPSKWPYLKLQINSTRPVTAESRLGLECLVRPARGKQSDAPYDFVMLKSVPMRSLEVGGGIVRSVCVRVTRVSPILHLQPKDFSIGPRILCEEHMPQYFQTRQEHIQDQRGDEANYEEEPSSSLPLPVPFVKLEVECAHDEDASRKCYAVLTVWRPGDEMLSKLKEGSKYYASSLSVSWKVDYGNLGVYMRVGTTKGSTFELAEPESGDSFKSPGKICESVERLIQRYQEHEQTMPKEKKLYGDVCVVVVRCEEAKTSTTRLPGTCSTTSTQHVFVTDMSCRLMSIRIQSTRVFKPPAGDQASGNELATRKKTPERLFTRGNKKVWSEGSVICINGLEVSHYDEKLGILDCDLVESSQLVSQPSKKSHFFQVAHDLRAALAHEDSAVDVARGISPSIERLRKHVERSILHLDVASSQDGEDDGLLLDVDNEAEHLTQDLQAVPESDVNYWMSQAHTVHAVGNVFRIIPLDPNDPLSIVCNAAAIAYIRSISHPDEEDALQALYLPQDVFEETRVLLCGDLDATTLSFEDDAYLSDRVLRFEAEWETSERLLNSWKPWERDTGATFLLATAVSVSSEGSP